MNQDELYDSYMKTLQQAMQDDENGARAEQGNAFAKAAELYRKASEGYAAAAAVLMDLMETCSSDEMDELEKSVDRLIAASKDLKELAAKTAAKPDPGLCAGGDDAEEGSFIPNFEKPKVTFEDVAGLYEAKQMIMDEIINPLLHKDLYQRFLIENNGGLLLFGPPGSGKTMLARAIANKAQMAFFSVRCSDIVGKYFGEAEKHVRALFEAARSAGNAVVFLDEAEALACRRGGNSTVMNRLVPELLSQMDGFEKFNGHLIVIFATNRPYDIDPAFLRPGRLPNHCYIPLPDLQVRKAFLQKMLSQRPCREPIDIDRLAQQSERFSCADLANLVKRACQLPVNRSIRAREQTGQAGEEFLTWEDLERARKSLHPSVEDAEIKRLEKWMKQVGMKVPGRRNDESGIYAYADRTDRGQDHDTAGGKGSVPGPDQGSAGTDLKAAG